VPGPKPLGAYIGRKGEKERRESGERTIDIPG